MRSRRMPVGFNPLAVTISIFLVAVIAYGCTSTVGETVGAPPPPPSLPVLTVEGHSAVTHQEFYASVEGSKDIEIRPQVEGYLDKIYVDEGSYVKAGQPLFKINDHIYNEQLHNAQSSLLAAHANVQKAQVEVDRLVPLVENQVVSDVQLKTAKAMHDASKASEEQARAMVGNAQINMGYTLIKAPVSGYVGRIPYKTGSLVGRSVITPLTMLSDVHEVYAYFSMSEPDFIAFKKQFEGNTLEEKLKKVPAVELLLADNTIYPEKGKITTIEGQFDKTMGAIRFRASFPNAAGGLRSGNTGRVRIPHSFDQAVVVPQDATFEIQDKVFVFVVDSSNKVTGKPVSISGKTSNYYFVNGGVGLGDKIVYSGIGNLRDGMTVAPLPVSLDSLLKAKPL